MRRLQPAAPGEATPTGARRTATRDARPRASRPRAPRPLVFQPRRIMPLVGLDAAGDEIGEDPRRIGEALAFDHPSSRRRPAGRRQASAVLWAKPAGPNPLIRLATWFRCEEQLRLRPRQIAAAAAVIPVRRADRAGIGQRIAEMAMDFARAPPRRRDIDEDAGRRRIQRFDHRGERPRRSSRDPSRSRHCRARSDRRQSRRRAPSAVRRSHRRSWRRRWRRSPGARRRSRCRRGNRRSGTRS